MQPLAVRCYSGELHSRLSAALEVCAAACVLFLMQTGIIGLPQVGKTSLFRILTRAKVDTRSAPAQMHLGIARVPDARVAKLAEAFKPKKVTYATIEYVDIGGLQKDREKNSASLVPLREADALAHVVRLFENPAVPHEAGSLDALRDIESVEIELMLYDLEQATKRIERVEKDLKKKNVRIDAVYVRKQLADIVKDQDLSRYIL